jgi:mannose-6-phosphate isomerase-like protein (cupin superfamily)
MGNARSAEKVPSMIAYKVGDSDRRPWGEYKVTAVGATAGGEEYCEKEITVNPAQILSLQSHEYRREHWIVRKGALTVVLDGEILTLEAGQDVRVPLSAIHCMANTGDAPCVVHERQEGICREEDIKRYVDSYGRGTESADDQRAADSIAAYNAVVAKIKSGK